VSVRLRPMRDDEFVAWLPRLRGSYAEDMVRHGGLSPEQAATKAAEDTARLFPGGRPSTEQFVHVIEADGQPVGTLWLAERDDGPHRRLFVYELYVDEAHRGRGHGRAAMTLAEAEARDRGIDRIALNVFGGNAVARGLYRSLGYEEQAVAMSKHL